MAPLSDYVTGTITLTNGSAAFTGTGTGWLAASFREGDTILGIEGNPGVTYVIESITDNDAGTLTQPWDGPTGTYEYRMRYLADGQPISWNSAPQNNYGWFNTGAATYGASYDGAYTRFGTPAVMIQTLSGDLSVNRRAPWAFNSTGACSIVQPNYTSVYSCEFQIRPGRYKTS